MARRTANNDFMDDLFAADEKKPKRRRVAATAPTTAGGPSGPAMSGGLNAMKSAPTKRRKRISKDDMKQLYG